MVETAAYIIQKESSQSNSRFYRVTKSKTKEIDLLSLTKGNDKINIYDINTNIFKSISNEPFCYWIDKKTLGLFLNSGKFENEKRGARLALKTADNLRYVRNHWEINSFDIALTKKDTLKYNWSFFLMSDSSTRFFISIETLVLFGKNGNELKSNINENGQLRSRPMDTYDVFYSKGLSWSFRTAKFQPHIIPSGNIATSGRCIAVFENTEQILYTNSLWNSEYMDYCLKLSMEADSGNPKFINGTVNQLPYPEISIDLQNQLIQISKNQYYLVKETYGINEKSLAFIDNSMVSFSSLTDFVNSLIENHKIKKSVYLNNLKKLNFLIYSNFEINEDEQGLIKELIRKNGGEEEGEYFDLKSSEIIESVFSILFGCVFNRWDLRILKFWKKEWSDEDIFKARKNSPFLFGEQESTLDLVLPEYHKKIKQIWEQPYPIERLKEIASSKDIVNKLKEVLTYFWGDSDSNIEFELQDHFGFNDLETIFTNPNKFFDSHLKDYSRNKRISPIYWPISTASGNYTIWLYYPKLNDQTLVAVINNYLQPKIDEVINQKKPLELNTTLDNKGLKELKELNDFEHELEEMKKELLRITALPYKPNHDDGVLITAAPLNKLFRHTKWRKATEDCWKELEKGDYDWAHLAYSIWTDRVTKKCKKDLSMAIAHGIENICEVKPKEKKEKVVKVGKKSNPINELNFGE